MAAVTHLSERRRSMNLLCISSAKWRWSDQRCLAEVCEMVLPEIVRHGPIEAIIDDIGFPRARAAFGRGWRGKTVVNSEARRSSGRGAAVGCESTMPACQWPDRLHPLQDRLKIDNVCAKAGAPVQYPVSRPSQKIVFEQWRWACEAGLARWVVLIDAVLWCRDRPAYQDHDVKIEPDRRWDVTEDDRIRPRAWCRGRLKGGLGAGDDEADAPREASISSILGQGTCCRTAEARMGA